MTSGASKPTKISKDDILGNFPTGQLRLLKKRLTPLQSAGMKIVFGISIFAFLALIPIMVMWFSDKPSTPDIDLSSITDTQTLANATKTIELYKTANEVAADQPQKWFDNLFVKILYPLSTLVLGYVFGAKTASETNNQPGNQ